MRESDKQVKKTKLNNMEGKDKLIYDIIMSSISGLEKVGRNQQKQINNLRENGYGDIHTAFQDEMKSGLSYTHGYTVGHIELAKIIMSLLKMTEEEIKSYIKKNKEIEKENKKYTKNLFKDMKTSNKKGQD